MNYNPLTFLGGPHKVPLGGGSPTALDPATTTTTSGGDGFSSLSVDVTDVYWATTQLMGGALMKTPKAGGGSTVLASNLGSIQSIALADELVYWTSGLRIDRVSSNGGNIDTLTAGPIAGEIAIAGGQAYWFDLKGVLMTVPLTGGTARALTPEGWGSTQLVVDGSTIYLNGAKGFAKVATSGGVPTIIHAGIGSSRVFVGATHFYWSSNATKTITRLEK